MLENEINKQALYSLREFVDFVNQINDKAKHEPASVLLDELISYIQYESYLYEHYDEKMAANKWQNTLEFINWLKSKGTSISDIDADGIEFGNQDGLSNSKPKNLLELTQMISLMTLLEGKNDSSNHGVQLSTLHAAKGLEFGHVYLLGVEEGILPFNNGDDKQSDIEEERRLMYVGVTRAKRSLHISWCKQRRRNGEKISIQPSRFLEEMSLSTQSSNEKSKVDPKAYLEMMKTMFD
jgi:ATP-dependent DNA helicase Rep